MPEIALRGSRCRPRTGPLHHREGLEDRDLGAALQDRAALRHTDRRVQGVGLDDRVAARHRARGTVAHRAVGGEGPLSSRSHRSGHTLSAPGAGGTVRVLVVEDGVKMAGLLKRALEEEGYAVDVAADGREGLWLGTENAYDAVVLDVMLPQMDGFAVCRGLRDAGRWSPVLMLTARDAVADRVAGLDAGADDYLTKPFSVAEMLARIRALIRRGAVERPSVLRVGDLTLDPASKGVSRDGTAGELTAKELALREDLMRHAGEGLSRTRAPPTASPCTPGPCATRSTGRSDVIPSRRCGASATVCGATREAL